MTLTHQPLTLREPARRRRHAADFSDAVVAGYIHEISARNRPVEATRQGRSRRPRESARTAGSAT
jgi:hypothetical protein